MRQSVIIFEPVFVEGDSSVRGKRLLQLLTALGRKRLFPLGFCVQVAAAEIRKLEVSVAVYSRCSIFIVQLWCVCVKCRSANVAGRADFLCGKSQGYRGTFQSQHVINRFQFANVLFASYNSVLLFACGISRLKLKFPFFLCG